MSVRKEKEGSDPECCRLKQGRCAGETTSGNVKKKEGFPLIPKENMCILYSFLPDRAEMCDNFPAVTKNVFVKK